MRGAGKGTRMGPKPVAERCRPSGEWSARRRTGGSLFQRNSSPPRKQPVAERCRPSGEWSARRRTGGSLFQRNSSPPRKQPVAAGNFGHPVDGRLRCLLLLTKRNQMVYTTKELASYKETSSSDSMLLRFSMKHCIAILTNVARISNIQTLNHGIKIRIY